MDLRLVCRVAWRFRILIAIGLLLAVAAALFGGSILRGEQQWQSVATLHVTQQGDPSFRAVIPEVVPLSPKPGRATTVTPAFADPSRFTTLAADLAKLSAGDQVRREVLGGRIGDSRYGIYGEQLLTTQASPLPFIAITAVAPSAGEAIALRDAAVKAVHRDFAPSDIPAAQRIVLQSVSQPESGETGAVTLVKGASKTLPIAIFVSVALLTFGLAFLLENLFPRTATALGIDTDDIVGVPGADRQVPAMHRPPALVGAHRHEDPYPRTSSVARDDLGAAREGAWVQRLSDRP